MHFLSPSPLFLEQILNSTALTIRMQNFSVSTIIFDILFQHYLRMADTNYFLAIYKGTRCICVYLRDE